MNRYLGVFVALIVFAAAVVTGTSRYKASALEADRELNLARIQGDYLERAGWIRSIPDEKAYKEEVNGFLRWYFREINEHLSRFHGNRKFDDYLSDLSKRVENPKERSERKAHYDYTKKFFDELRTGAYSPVFSATDKGMRLDVASASVATGQSKPEVKLGIALWGAQRELRDESTAANGITAVIKKKMTTSASFNVIWKLYDDKAKLIGEMTAQGDPAMKVDYPEKYIREFPPQMVLGYYAMDLIPAEVAKINILFQVVSRAPSGGEATAEFIWKLDAPRQWKLNPGEKWENAEESVRPAEEVDPRAGTKESVSSRK
jgi:hypothetical protein